MNKRKAQYFRALECMRRVCFSLLMLSILLPTHAGAVEIEDGQVDLFHVEASKEPDYPALSIGRLPIYRDKFEHFPWVNPDAPKGCRIVEVARGTFDSINPWILKGRSLTHLHSALYDTLLMPSPDEEMVGYGLIANRMEVFDDGRRVIFHINPQAEFHDGHKVDAHDVVFTAETFRNVARPHWQVMLRELDVRALDDRRVEVKLHDGVEPTALLEFASIPIIPEHYWRDRNFGTTTLEPFLGGGAYKILKVNPGRSVTLGRVADYWARDLPVNKGRFNLDEIVYEFFLDEVTGFQAFLSGNADKFSDNSVRRWETMYNVEAVRDGRIKRYLKPSWWPLGMNGFFFNLRHERFQDIRVREALSLLFDFDWPNKNVFHGAFSRTESYFQNSEFAASEAPSEEEKALMEKWRGHLPDAAFSEPWKAHSTDGTGRDRERFRQALDLFTQAGWKFSDGALRHEKTGEVFTFRVMANTAAQEIVLGPFFNNLERAGIKTGFEVVDTAVYQARSRDRRFEVIYRFYIPPTVPRDEQLEMWGSAAVRKDGKDNSFGINDPMVDEFALKLKEARTLQEKRLYAKVLDRALQWGLYVIPSYYDPYSMGRIAYWDKYEIPKISPKSGSAGETWWCRAAEKTAKQGM